MTTLAVGGAATTPVATGGARGLRQPLAEEPGGCVDVR